jgi:prepilin-type N-terminal cleavage/methylation domain-containing protein
MLANSCVRSRAPKRSAVTLLELLAALAIIGILAALSVVLFSHMEKAAENIETRANTAKFGKKKGIRKPSGPKYRDDSVIVAFKPGTANPKAEAVRLAELCSGSVLYDYSGPFLGCALKIQPGTQDRLANDRVVASMGADRVYHAHLQTVPMGITRLNASPLLNNSLSPNNKIQNVQTGPRGVDRIYGAVAVIDTGVDNTHPDLNVVFNLGFNNPSFGDPAMHGTHVAGVIGAMDNNFGVVGVAPGAPIWNLRVLDANGNGFASDLIAALQFIATQVNQVPVVNLSLGAFPPPDPFVDAAVTYCVNQGQVVVVCASNESIDVVNESPPGVPAAICVAGLTDSDGLPGGLGPLTVAGPDDTFADFSNFGTLVKVVAPAVNVLSTLPGNSYGYGTGTSAAAPHVAGIAARIQSPIYGKIRNVLPAGVNGKYTPAQVLQIILQNSTETIPGIFDNRTYPVANAKGL